MNPSEREHLISEVLDRFGSLDVLVNNAAIIRLGRFLDISEETFSEVMQNNFYAPLYLARSFSKKLISLKKSGSIINITSVGAHQAGNISYCTSKSSLLFASRCMARELAKHNIRVNCISPGMVETDLNLENRDKNPEEMGRNAEVDSLKKSSQT